MYIQCEGFSEHFVLWEELISDVRCAWLSSMAAIRVNMR